MSTVDLKEKNVEIRVGSDSDLPKIKPLIDQLRESNITVLVRILSAHRTPEAMAQAAKNFPEVQFVGVDNIIDQSQLDIALCFAAAGGSAHIAGMTASETNIPVIAIPVASTAMGTIDSTYSMINMPPGIPNGFSANQEMAATYGKRIMKLTKENTEKIYIPADLQKKLGALIKEFGIAVTDQEGEVDIGIHTILVDGEVLPKHTVSNIPVLIPVVSKQVSYGRDGTIGIVTENLQELPGLSMGLQLNGNNINATNAFLYCMKLVALFHPEVAEKLTTYREKLAAEVKTKDQKLVNEQIKDGHLDTVLDVALPARYNRVHGGKVRETYQNPDNENELIMIATDRISTHDVVHKNRIPGKGKILTQVSNYWFNYFKTQEATKGIPTQLVEDAAFPADFPEEYKNKAVIVKKLNPLPIEAIMRGRLYGSALDDGKGNKYDPMSGKLATGEFVGEGLKKGSEFNEPKFTPSTKGKVDVNINFDDMIKILEKRLETEHPQWIGRAKEYAEQVRDYSTKMFVTARDHASEKGIILADTKFEFAIDDKGVLHIIDEVLTPDSSRYWEAEGYIIGEEPISFDKQDTRTYVMDTWTKMGKKKEKPSLPIPQDVIEKTQKRYETIEEKFS